MVFEWHEPKRLANIRVHHLDFADADLPFGGLHLIAPARTVDGGKRWLVTGTLDDVYVTAVFTRRGDIIRLISMRRARNGEREAHQEVSTSELDARRARGESRTDLGRLRAKSDAELERDIASDPDFAGEADNWYKAAEAVIPAPKKLLSLRLDSDVVEWFKQQGPGYQTRMNAVLRAFVEQVSKRRA